MTAFTYRCWSHASRNIYSGMTNNLERRLAEHERNSLWWPQVRNVTYEEWPTRTEAAWAEWIIIVTEQPTNNRHLVKAGLPFPRPTTLPARLAFRAAMHLGRWPNR